MLRDAPERLVAAQPASRLRKSAASPFQAAEHPVATPPPSRLNRVVAVAGHR
jgi:hypothetical protein